MLSTYTTINFILFMLFVLDGFCKQQGVVEQIDLKFTISLIKGALINHLPPLLG